jgi:hypothetical protein
MLRIPAFICKCSLPCILLITALLMFVHQQPDQLSDLQDFLLPPTDCAVPCFLGIRPGVTSLVAAIEALRANPWIRSVVNFSPSRYDLELTHTVAAMRMPRMPLLLDVRENIVNRISLFDPGFRLSDVILTLGRPAHYSLNASLHVGFVTYVAFYPQLQMHVEANLPLCAFQLSSFWNAQPSVSIGIETEQTYAKQANYYGIDNPQTLESWSKQIQNIQRVKCA